MRRSTRITILSALGLAATLTVVIIVSAVITHLPEEPPDRDRLPEQALTPEEMTLSVQPQVDGNAGSARVCGTSCCPRSPRSPPGS